MLRLTHTITRWQQTNQSHRPVMTRLHMGNIYDESVLTPPADKHFFDVHLNTSGFSCLESHNIWCKTFVVLAQYVLTLVTPGFLIFNVIIGGSTFNDVPMIDSAFTSPRQRCHPGRVGTLRSALRSMNYTPSACYSPFSRLN